MISEVKVPLVWELRELGIYLFSCGLHNETANGDIVDWATVNTVQLEGQEAKTVVAILLAHVEF